MNREQTLVRIRAKTAPEGGCLRWTGAHTQKGYGSVNIDGKTRQLHRVIYELLVGPIPDGLEIDHLCHVRDCIEVSHLDVVTHAENLRRRRPGAARGLRVYPDHCPKGHPFTPENTIWSRWRKRANPSRRCRACKQAINAARPSRARKESTR